MSYETFLLKDNVNMVLDNYSSRMVIYFKKGPVRVNVPADFGLYRATLGDTKEDGVVAHTRQKPVRDKKGEYFLLSKDSCYEIASEGKLIYRVMPLRASDGSLCMGFGMLKEPVPFVELPPLR